MKRLRFSNYQNEPTLLTNKHKLIIPDGLIYCIIDTKTLTFKVYGMKGYGSPQKVLTEGKGKTLNDCKKFVKEALKAYGVTFEDEVRDRKTEGDTDEKGQTNFDFQESTNGNVEVSSKV